MSTASSVQQTGTTSAAAATSQTALTGLSSNFQDFLSLLMTQLKNQDPTSPLDTNQFTSELVQFTSVEQQIATNSSLTQLIQLTQSGQMLQAAGFVGHQVAVNSPSMVVQDGTGTIRYTAPAAGPVGIAVYAANGRQIAGTTVDAKAGSNDWSWNAGDGSYPDGAYTVAVTGAGAQGASTAIPFSVLATATGVQASGNALQLTLGAATVPFSEVTGILK